MKFDAELDTSGLVCPVPALKTKKKLRTMRPGQILRVYTDYKPASESVPRDLKKTKHKYLETEVLEEGWNLIFLSLKIRIIPFPHPF